MSEKQILKCPYCNFLFENTLDLTRHVMKKHNYPVKQTYTYIKNKTLVVKKMPYLLTLTPYNDDYLLTLKRATPDVDQNGKRIWLSLTLRLDEEAFTKFKELVKNFE